MTPFEVQILLQLQKNIHAFVQIGDQMWNEDYPQPANAEMYCAKHLWEENNCIPQM